MSRGELSTGNEGSLGGEAAIGGVAVQLTIAASGNIKIEPPPRIWSQRLPSAARVEISALA